jgi:sugar O-acyltransferase (sialic acid O-acetyltransferase NeuD family)
MAKVVIFGDSYWADLAHVYLTHDSPHEVVGFTLDRGYMKTDRHLALPVVPFDEVEDRFPPDVFKMFVPISFKRMNHIRADKYTQAKRKGYELISYVSSRASVWPGFQCGDNCFIGDDNTIQPFVQIGNDVVMWSGNHIGHHTVINDHVTITSHVAIAGSCRIESYCFLGFNATVRDETTIARETLVGAGAVIMNDTKEFEVYIATPTRPAGVRSDHQAIGIARRVRHKIGG